MKIFKTALFALILLLISLQPVLAQNAHYDYILNSSMSGGWGASAKFQSKVSKTSDAKYVYWYRVENKGNAEILVVWEFLNEFGLMPFLIQLKPGESKEFSIESKNPPVETLVQAVLFQKTTDMNDSYEQIIKEAPKGELKLFKDGVWMATMSGQTSGFLPKK